MTRRPWMPLYIADYLADTMHLTAAQSGAYLHLIMHYWQHGGLPDDDAKLALIARMRIEDWRRHRGTVGAFFQGRWRHARIDRELARSAEISNKRKGAALQMHAKKDANAHANAEQMHTQSHSQRKKDTEATLPPAAPAQPPDPSIAERELFDRGKSVLGQNSGGLIVELKRSKGGNTALARAVIEEASTKQNPREYVSGAIKGNSHGKNNGSSSVAIARELAAYYREEEAALGNVRNLRSG
jgi:uncharacterized protein YdaU (DUF1376 family)